MSAVVTKTTIVYRRWDENHGLQESEGPIQHLSDLFELCLKTSKPDIVDRIIIEGVDSDQAPRKVVLTFQSASGVDVD